MTKKNDAEWAPRKGDVLDFLDDGKESRRRSGAMKVVNVVRGLSKARAICYCATESSPDETLLDIWRRTAGADMKTFGSVGYRVFDWGCDTFVVCEPEGRRGWEVPFARTADGGWYTLEDDDYNGELIRGPGVSGLKAAARRKKKPRPNPAH